jgi:Protein of unknown function (DUF3011)
MKSIWKLTATLALIGLMQFGAQAQSGTGAADAENSKYYRTQPGSNGEYFDTRTMRWFTRDGQPCGYCTADAGYNVPVEQIGQGSSQSRYAFVDGYFFSPYELAWFDRNGECIRCDPSTGFWIPDEFAQTAEYRKERRRFAQLLTGVSAPLPDGRPASAPRAGQGFGGLANTNLPLRFDARQLRWVDQSGQACQACTPENGFWIPPQFANEAEFRDQQSRYIYLVGTMRREVPPPNYGGGNGATANEIECASKNSGYQLCRVDTGRGVTLVRQLSKTQCVQNQNWGFTREGIWVDRGCRARFAIVR